MYVADPNIDDWKAQREADFRARLEAASTWDCAVSDCGHKGVYRVTDDEFPEFPVVMTYCWEHKPAEGGFYLTDEP